MIFVEIGDAIGTPAAVRVVAVDTLETNVAWCVTMYAQWDAHRQMVIVKAVRMDITGKCVTRNATRTVRIRVDRGMVFVPKNVA